MNKLEKLQKLENIKQKYILLRDFVLYCKYLQFNEELSKEKKNENVKTLVLTKPFHGRELKVG